MLGMVNNAPVVYLGTFSKTLFPSLEWGSWCYRQRWRRRHVPPSGSLLRGHRAEQRTTALFIEEDHYARHLAAMRRLYRKRYRQLREVLAQSFIRRIAFLPEKEDAPALAIDGIDDQRLVEQAKAFQLAPAALSGYYLQRDEAGQTGLVLGYGNTSASQFAPGIRRFRR